MGGEGSIYRRKSDGRWVAKISRGPRGSQQTVVRYGPSRAEALEALAELRGTYGKRASRSLTVGAYLASWSAAARNLRAKTRVDYRGSIDNHITPRIGAIRLVELDPMHVELMLSSMPSPPTARLAHAVLRRALGQAVKAGLVPRNVAASDYVDSPKVDAEEPEILTPQQVKLITLALEGHPLEAHITVALGTGLRQGEQLGLSWGDVDFEAQALHVRAGLAREAGQYVLNAPKTKRSKRIVPLAPAVLSVLQRHREAIVAAGFAPVADGPVFINRRGGDLSGSWLTHAWHKFLVDIGIEPLPWKALRATFSSRLFAAGVPDRVIADLLGHSRTHTTHRHYISTEGPEAARDALAALLPDTYRDTYESSVKVDQNAPNNDPTRSVERESGAPGGTRTPDPLIRSQRVSLVKRAS